MTTPARQPAIDIFKLIAAVLVITIHTDPLSDLSQLANFALVDIVARIAVPFFIVCTGFFLGKRFCYTNGRLSNIKEARSATLRSAFRIGKLYLIWSLLYLPILIQQWIASGWFSSKAFVDWGVAFFLKGSYVHLWYLIEVCYALLVLALILPLLKKTTTYILMTVLWIIEVLDYAYVAALPSGIQTVFAFLDKLQMPFESIVRVLPLLLIGIIVSQQKQRKRAFYLVGFTVSSLLLILEVYGVKMLGGERFSFIFTTLPVAYFLFSTVHSFGPTLKASHTVVLAKISTFVYLIHPALIWLLSLIAVIPNLLTFAIVTALSLAAGFICYKIQRLFRRQPHS